MPAFDEEVFGPVAAVVRFTSIDDAIALANATPYGLGASVWTTDTARGRALVPQLHAGTVAINGIVRSDPRLPFGGIGHSGLGRELAFEGAVAFANVKTVWLEDD
jgi:succinate-semialdehyde dehydrogenase/glutarate-semialdehyde dehydrogenase